jgi:HJR/Mrr/RecB family endonuclease
MSKLSRDKGAEFEREVAKLFHKLGYPDAKRRLGQARDSGHDLDDTGRFVVECKRRRTTIENEAWLAQVQQSARRSKLPIVVARSDGGSPYVLMTWKTFTEIAQHVPDDDRLTLEDLL